MRKKDRTEEALLTFAEGYNCSQAVLAVYSTVFGMSRKTALKIACGFGAGFGRLGETCGAVTGAMMVIGLKYGKVELNDEAAKERTYKMVNDFIDKFKVSFASLNCKELLGYDLSKPEELMEVKKMGVMDRVCPKFVMKSVEILNEMLEDEKLQDIKSEKVKNI